MNVTINQTSGILIIFNQTSGINITITPINPFINAPQYTEYTDGEEIWRKGARSGEMVIDKALTATGFDGIENIDWVNKWSVS